MTERTISAEEREEALDSVRKIIRARRLHHYTHTDLASGCCRNCDRRLQERAVCARCGQPYLEWTSRCTDPEAEAALADLARLSAWVSGDVARARELAEAMTRSYPMDGGLSDAAQAEFHWDTVRHYRNRAAEIVALLTPPEGE